MNSLERKTEGFNLKEINGVSVTTTCVNNKNLKEEIEISTTAWDGNIPSHFINEETLKGELKKDEIDRLGSLPLQVGLKANPPNPPCQGGTAMNNKNLKNK